MARLDIWDMTGRRTIIRPVIVGALWVKAWFPNSHDLRYAWVYVSTVELLEGSSAYFISTANIVSFETDGGNPIEREEPDV